MLISEIKRRTFCKLLGVLGLSGMGCNIDYNVGHLKDENEAGEPLPKCIQNPQFEPAFDDPIWREGNVKLDDFVESIPNNDFVFSKYENDELVILIQNVPIDADIFNATHAASSGGNVFSEEQVANYYALDSEDPKVLISIEMKLPLQIKQGEYYVKSFVDTGGNFGTIPQRNSSECSGDYIAWLEPKLYESVSNMIDEVIEEKKKKKQQKGKKRARKVASRKKKKSSGKKDACYHKVRSRYDVWPSAYASGALVKCRKVGAKNWGNKSKNEEIELEEMEIIDEEQEETTLDEKRKKRRKSKKRKKAGTESSKESSLRDWFKRKGAKGSKGGWVDCNAPDGKGGYKSCGRGSGEKRKKYPACRPTPSACKERGRGKSWGKKGSKRRKSRRNEELLRTMVREEAEKTIFGKTISEGLRFHIDNDMPIRDNVYRHGTGRYFSLVNEARDLWKEGKLNLDEEDIEIMESDLGQFGSFAGQQVPLDFPMMIDESLDEAKKKKKKKKDPPIGKPTKNTGGGKKYKVFVRNPKTGKIKKITYGDSKGGLKGNWNSAEARKSFASRHNCKDKKDRTKAGYWACRAHKDFGTNVPGRFW